MFQLERAQSGSSRLWIALAVAVTSLAALSFTDESWNWSKIGEWSVSGSALEVPAREGDLTSQVALDAGGRLHVIFEGLASGSRKTHIQYRAYDVKANQWSDVRSLGDELHEGVLPSIALHGTELYAVWLVLSKREKGTAIAYARSLDQGGEWSLQSFEIGQSNRKPRLTVGPEGDLWICTSAVASPGTNEKLVLLHSRDGGTTWRRMSVGPSDQAVFQSRPELQVLPQGRCLLSWIESAPDHAGLMVSRFEMNHGWSPPVQVIRGERDPVIDFQMASLGGQVCLAWTERGEHSRTMNVAVTEDGGRSWELRRQVSQKLCRLMDFRMLKVDGDLQIVWRQALDPFHLGEHSIWRMRVSGMDGTINAPECLESSRRHLSGLAVAGANKSFYVFVTRMERVGVRPVLYRGEILNGTHRVWEGRESESPDLEVVALKPLGQGILLLYREAKPVGNPALRILEGDLRLIRLGTEEAG